MDLPGKLRADFGAGEVSNGRELEERESRGRAEQFAQALNSVRAELRSAFAGVNPSTEVRRQPDAVLTRPPAAGTNGATSGGAGAGSPDVTAQRLTFRIDGGTLGQLKLVVDRSTSGLKLVIGVNDKRAAAEFRREAAQLTEVLQRKGLSVASLNVVRVDQVGTVLARLQGAKTTSRTESQQDMQRAKAETGAYGKRRNSKKIDLIG